MNNVPSIFTACGMTATQLRGPIKPRDYIIPGLIPTANYSLLSGALSAAKTTLMLTLAASRATGFDLLNLTGDDPIAPGLVVLIVYEDDREEVERRVQEVVQAWERRLSDLCTTQHELDRFVNLVARHLRWIVLTGEERGCIVHIGERGMAERNERALQLIAQQVGELGAAEGGVLLCVDPLRLALRGISQNDDMGADVAISALQWLSRQWQRSGVLVASHWTKSGATNAGDNVDPMVAAYGTAGSALWSQHARSNLTLHRLDPKDAKHAGLRGEVTELDAIKRRVVRLTHGRLSGGESSATRDYLHTTSGLLVPLARPEPLLGDARLVALLREVSRITGEARRMVENVPVVSANTIEADEGVRRIGRQSELRTTLHRLRDLGLIAWHGPTGGRNAGGYALTAEGHQVARSGHILATHLAPAQKPDTDGVADFIPR